MLGGYLDPALSAAPSKTGSRPVLTSDVVVLEAIGMHVLPRRRPPRRDPAPPWSWPTTVNVIKEPLDWTDAHHVLAWTDGGATDLGNLVLLCRRHHRLIHDPAAGWHIRIAADGRPEFIPPPTVDPGRRPRRNLYHPRLRQTPTAP
jgi:HNH endonuclease